MSKNIQFYNLIFQDLEKSFNKQIPNNINLLDQAKIIKENVLFSVEAAIKLAELSEENDLLNLTTEKEALQKERKNIKEEVVTIAVFGHVSSGKSSFVNSLIEKDLLTVKEERATSIITKLRHPYNYPKVKVDVEIVYKNENDIFKEFDKHLTKFIKITSIYFDELKDIIDHRNIEKLISNKDKYLSKIEELSKSNEDLEIHKDYMQKFFNGLSVNKQNLGQIYPKTDKNLKELLVDENQSVFIKEINYYKENELLKNIQLVDTPGIGSYNELDTEISKTFLERSDIILFITDAKNPLGNREEIKFFNLIYLFSKKNNKILNKVFIIVNKIDDTEKDKNRIKEMILERLNNIFETFNQKHIFYVSALNEEHKRNKKQLLEYKNSTNYDPEEFEKLKNTLYTFSTIESNIKFLEEKIKKVDRILKEVDKIFKNSLFTVNKNINEIDNNIKEFNNIKQEIKNKLHKEIEQNIYSFFEEKNKEIYIYLLNKIKKVSNESYIKDLAERKKIYNNSKTEEDFQNSTHFFIEKELSSLTNQIEEYINDVIFSKDTIYEIEEKINKKITHTISKLQKKYNISFYIDQLNIRRIELDIKNSVKIKKNWFRELFYILRKKKNKHMSLLGRHWRNYILKDYSKLLFIEKIFTIDIDDFYFDKLNKDITKNSKKISEKLKRYPEEIKSQVIDEIESLINTIENKLTEQKKFKAQSEDDKKAKENKQKIIQEKFQEIQLKYIEKTRQQNEKLSKIELNNFKIGVDYFNAKEYHKAILSFEKSLSQDTDENKVNFYIAQSYIYLKKYEKAKKYFNKTNHPKAKEFLEELKILTNENSLLVTINDNLTAKIVYKQEFFDDKNDGLKSDTLRKLTLSIVEKIEDELLNGDESIVVFIKSDDEAYRYFKKYFEGKNSIVKV